MRIPCPCCGERDLREFVYLGSHAYLDRPDHADWGDAWDAYLHRRANPEGHVRDLWYHQSGCGAWLVVDRSTATHAILAARLPAARPETAQGPT